MLPLHQSPCPLQLPGVLDEVAGEESLFSVKAPASPARGPAAGGAAAPSSPGPKQTGLMTAKADTLQPNRPDPGQRVKGAKRRFAIEQARPLTH
ncbi:hypothetical protein GCM10027039_08110 [Terrabacter koreensis]